jgi:hypothetical protein
MQASECKGSLVSVRPQLVGMKSLCPFCGASVTIGYGGRIPSHEDPAAGGAARLPERLNA